MNPRLKCHIVQMKEDVFACAPPAGIDFLFEDGAHAPGFTGRVLQKMRPFLKPEAAVLCHDYHNAKHGAHVSTEFDNIHGRSRPVGLD